MPPVLQLAAMPHQIPVAGGTLAVDVHSGNTRPVLAVHGVSSNRRLWDWVRARWPELSLIAPDLRGRGESATVGEPYGLRQHTEDLLRVLDALGLDSVVVCGMSMGGFVGVDLATAHPDRVSELVLVDGGLPMARNARLTREMVPAAFAPQLAAIARTWSGLDEYVAAHTAADSLLSPADPHLRDYLGHFLTEDGHVRLNGDALLADATDVFFGPSPWQRLITPTWLVYAEWSVDRDSTPAYSPEAVAAFRAALPCLAEPVRVPGVDHAALVMTDHGAAAVADVLKHVLG